MTTPNDALHILQMGKHFLYLPIYFAENQQFFGFLPHGMRVVIDPPLHRQTDVATYDQMMDDDPRYRDFQMAITDPVQILRTPLDAKRKPAVLATLVTNAAFWAVNHGSHQIKGFRDLGAFDKVIAYSKGTTSYNIAARIAHDAGKNVALDQFIQVVSPGDELVSLSKTTLDANVMALSPELLDIEWLESEKKVSVELALGDTPEFNDVVVAALVSNDDFVNRHPDVVLGVLCGIQRALLMVRRMDPQVVSFASQFFHFGEKAEGAIRKAVSCSVVPSCIRLDQAHWLNAARVSREFIATNQAWPLSDEHVANEYYRVCIAPYHHYADDAIRKVDGANLAKNKPRLQLPVYPIVFTAILVAAMAASLGGIRTVTLIIILTVVWLLIGALRQHATRNKVAVGFWTIVTIGTVLVVLPFVPALGLEAHKEFLVGCGIACLAPGLIELIKHYGYVHER